MSVRIQNNVSYGLSQPLIDTPLLPIVSNRAPGFNDKAPIGTIWVDKSQNTAYLLTSIVNDEATWVNITQDTADFQTVTAQTLDGNPLMMASFPMAPNSSLSLGGYYLGTRDDFAETIGGNFSITFLRTAAAAPVVVNAQQIPRSETDGVNNADFFGDINGNAAALIVIGNGGETWNWKVVLTTVVLP